MKKLVIIFLLSVIVVILLLRRTSSYPPGTAAGDPSLLPVPLFDANSAYQDITPTDTTTWTATTYVKDPSATISLAQLNINCWNTPNCWGIRHSFDTDKGSWYLMTNPTGKTKLPTVVATVTWNGASYSVPNAVVIAKSLNDPTAPTNCVWSSTTPPCSPAPCNTPAPSTTTTWSISVPAAHQGTCAPAPASTTNACPSGPQCPWIPWTALSVQTGTPATSTVYTF